MPASKGVGGTRHWHTNPKGLPGGARKAQAQDESQNRVPAALSAVASSRQLGAGETRRRGPKRRAGSVEQDAGRGLVPTTLS